MPKFEVQVYRQVQDSVRAFVYVEADNADDAIEKAREQVDEGEVEFDFWQVGEICCGAEGCHDDEYEAREVATV